MTTLTAKVNELMNEFYGVYECNCAEINARIYKINTSILKSVCCPLCCYHEWEAILAEATELDECPYSQEE